MTAARRRRSSLASCAWLALLLGGIGCDGPSPAEVCARAGTIVAALNVNSCASDLTDEKASDPATYEEDVKCLGALRPGNPITLCLDNPRSLARVAQDQARVETDLAAQAGALDAQFAKLRGAVGKLGTKDQAAFDKLLGVAEQQGNAVKQQLELPAPSASAAAGSR